MGLGNEGVLVELARTLGSAAPLVVLLWWLLRQATEERRDITVKFLQTLETTIQANAQSSLQLTSALADLASATNARNSLATAEHARMLELLAAITSKINGSVRG